MFHPSIPQAKRVKFAIRADFRDARVVANLQSISFVQIALLESFV